MVRGMGKTWERQHPVKREKVGDAGGFTIRWAHDDEKPIWCDFAIYPVLGVELGGRVLYETPDAVNPMDAPTSDLDAAQPLVTGFVKWDGCTQWWQHDGGHVDDRATFEEFFDALAEARRVALTEMLVGVLDDEYPEVPGASAGHEPYTWAAGAAASPD
jgi:hypothetical protein